MTKITEKKPKLPYISLSKGLAIRKVAQSKNWGIYLKLEGEKALQFSSRTADQAEATIKAWKEYGNAVALVENGYSLQQSKKRLSLHQMIDELIVEYTKLQKMATDLKPVRIGNEKYSTEIRHWSRIKSFYDIKMSLNQLTTSEVRDYFLNLEAPSKTQLGRISFCFRTIFERALENKLINRDQVVDLSKIKVEKKHIEERDAFTPDEFSILIYFAMTGYKTKGKGIKHNQMCIFYVGFMYHSGLRSGEEMMGLKWSDLSLNSHGDLYCTVRKGKTENYTKKNRNVILDLLAHGFLMFVAQHKYSRLIKGKCENEALEFLSQNYPNEHIFTTTNSDKPDYRTTFNNWIRELREKNMISHNKHFVLYSMRHSYITNALEKNVPLTLIAENAGTSVRMIEEHYSHTSVMNENARKYLVSDKLLRAENEAPKEVKKQTKEELKEEQDKQLKNVIACLAKDSPKKS